MYQQKIQFKLCPLFCHQFQKDRVSSEFSKINSICNRFSSIFLSTLINEEWYTSYVSRHYLTDVFDIISWILQWYSSIPSNIRHVISTFLHRILNLQSTFLSESYKFPNSLQRRQSTDTILSPRCCATFFLPHHSPPFQRLLFTKGNDENPLPAGNITEEAPDSAVIEFCDDDRDKIAEYSDENDDSTRMRVTDYPT